MNDEQIEGRLYREGQLTAVSTTEYIEPMNTDTLVKNMLDAKNAMKEIGPIYNYALSPLAVIQTIKEYVEETDKTNIAPHLWGTFCGIDIIPLDGLKDKLLMFKDSKSLKEFLDHVDKEKVLMLISQEQAVENTIKFYEFIGKIKSGEMVEKDVKYEQEICEGEVKLPFNGLGGQRL